MTLVRYHSPWGILGGLQQELRQLHKPLHGDGDGDCDNWVPAVDIKEESDKFCISADLPGVSPDAVEITVEGGYVSLSGSRNEENIKADGGYQRMERLQGKFQRRFSLPDSADAKGVSAESRNGVLYITVPKQEKELPRKIKVNH